jgi:hypothetical protein
MIPRSHLVSDDDAGARLSLEAFLDSAESRAWMTGDDGRYYLTQLCVTGLRRHRQALVAERHPVGERSRRSGPAAAVAMVRFLTRAAHAVLIA